MKETTMNPISKLALAAALALSSASFTLANAAQTAATTEAAGANHSTASSQTGASAASMSEGEIRKIDKEAGKVTIKHGPLTNLDMPAMTMIFRVKDPALLDQVKVGDKISFVADKVGGQFTVMQVEVQK
jgi:Cu(I)/Ag(I) efflux system periplasmic protein CusF